MNLQQAVALGKLQKQQASLLLKGQTTKTAKEIAELVFDLSAAAGEPFQNASPKAWASRWLTSKKFVLVELDPRQVAVPFANRISRSKVLATMQASASSLPPVVVDMNRHGIGKTSTGYVPSVILLDGKHRHRSQVLCGRDRISAWVGENALAELQARAATRKNFVIGESKTPGRPLSKIEVQAALMGPTGGSPVAITRQDTGDGGSRPSGGGHMPAPVGPARPVGRSPMPSRPVGPARPVTGFRAGAGGGAGGASAGAGPGGGVSGLNPARANLYSANIDPSDKTQFTDKEGATRIEPDRGNPEKQQPGAGIGPRVGPRVGSAEGTRFQEHLHTTPAGGASHSEMNQRLQQEKDLQAGPIKVKKLITKKKRKMEAVAPPGRERQVLKLKEKFGEDSATPYKIAWSQKNKGKN